MTSVAGIEFVQGGLWCSPAAAVVYTVWWTHVWLGTLEVISAVES